ncbi:hypothetical protein XH99_29355 [Bradyrhizobium nanningense]|uniref:Uncharacterized protein n=1 Tax=Bradyrhizobium nanningense TaxID=1325118 RepID=A0A4Q0RW82_9BRAD|nr:hypothetical protein XH99_29355 [Bradyrhizobium nanningense]
MRLEWLFGSKRVDHEAQRTVNDRPITKPADGDPGTVTDLESKTSDADLAGGVLGLDAEPVLAIGKSLGVERYLCRRPLIDDGIGRFVEVDADARFGHVLLSSNGRYAGRDILDD